MNKWFKRSVLLAAVGTLIIVIDVFFGYQINNLFSEYKIHWVGLAILFIGVLIIISSILAWFMGAKPVLDKELLGKD